MEVSGEFGSPDRGDRESEFPMLLREFSAAMRPLFAAMRERCARFIREGGAIPETL
jgi:hypothetical protein